MKKLFYSLLTALCIVITAGCGKSSEINGDTAPFEKSIAAYCRSHNYGMKVKEFIKLDVKGKTAEAEAKMTEAEGTYGISVRWYFKFEKQNGKWLTISHTAK